MVAALIIVLGIVVLYSGYNVAKFLEKKDIYNFVTERRRGKYASTNDSHS